MEYNPLVDGLMTASYKQLARVKAFSKLPLGEIGGGVTPEDSDSLLRFVVFFCDPQSPYAETKDIAEKIKEIFIQMKVTKKSFVAKEVQNQGDVFRKFLFEYFKLIHSIEYEAWASLKMVFHNLCNLLRTPISPDAKPETLNNLRQIAKDIPELKSRLVDMEYKLFQDKRLLALIKDAALEESAGGYAEQNADALGEWLSNG